MTGDSSTDKRQQACMDKAPDGNWCPMGWIETGRLHPEDGQVVLVANPFGMPPQETDLRPYYCVKVEGCYLAEWHQKERQWQMVEELGPNTGCPRLHADEFEFWMPLPESPRWSSDFPEIEDGDLDVDDLVVKTFGDGPKDT